MYWFFVPAYTSRREVSKDCLGVFVWPLFMTEGCSLTVFSQKGGSFRWLCFGDGAFLPFLLFLAMGAEMYLYSFCLCLFWKQKKDRAFFFCRVQPPLLKLEAKTPFLSFWFLLAKPTSPPFSYLAK